jgi:hypothetical protein
VGVEVEGLGRGLLDDAEERALLELERDRAEHVGVVVDAE